IHSGLSATTPEATIGYRDGLVVADPARYARWRHLQAKSGRTASVWRSGIKHDCARVMELTKDGDRHRNGVGESVDLEPDCLFPMLKGSEIAARADATPERWMIVTQRRPGDDTRALRETSPKLWRYLEDHEDLLGRRKSSIYRNRPPFSIFGVGDYAFADWKV